MLTDPFGTDDITSDIIASAIEVHRALGPGLLESAYVACLTLELTERGHSVELRKAVPLVYKSIKLEASYQLDMLVNCQIIVELKSVDALLPVHEAQLLTYLRLTGCPVGLLINFNVQTLKDGIRRRFNSKP